MRFADAIGLLQDGKSVTSAALGPGGSLSYDSGTGGFVLRKHNGETQDWGGTIFSLSADDWEEYTPPAPPENS